ncbi:MAG: 16S rRNA (cytidine(1402)-2'-O)-methyltransferase [Verrucomicrobia bacterium]|nr:16S rRNA (cytidine(1402)-2'-O)-methyltransferase [Verrucomicrobiota bacterium]MBU4291692.1 16S rRNA (cytidine(1402)-2'-O)-methyltransferase [Verrucomicrobiota bacterium]MBU4428102.1 16S rRNA (cytidine(1402)-2'-O)-methyltransferase [Verrucomicrobiota bacterium]MCG2680421.1 16S rRNA (cytidine(1402)-2'-O)-methyltransferase [Kiritimatiellia bacterium]
MKPGIYIVGTPIGHLGDISGRALDTLRSVAFILAEDTRHTHTLLQRYQIRATLISCHRFNEASRVQMVMTKVKAGSAAALVTNAGMPGVSDPGARIVAACRKEGLYITVIPGPSSVTAALALSGFGGGGFLFDGFLPRKAGARKRRLQEFRCLPLPVVLFESPYRWLTLLAEMSELFPQRELFMARELTKMNEECVWGTVVDLRDTFSHRAGQNTARAVRGELVAVLAPASKAEQRFEKQAGGGAEGEGDSKRS